jgi:hypothetical protein
LAQPDQTGGDERALILRCPFSPGRCIAQAGVCQVLTVVTNSCLHTGQ